LENQKTEWSGQKGRLIALSKRRTREGKNLGHVNALILGRQKKDASQTERAENTRSRGARKNVPGERPWEQRKEKSG